MSKITNYGLTRSGAKCFIAVPYPYMATVGVKGCSKPSSFPFIISFNYPDMILCSQLLYVAFSKHVYTKRI